MSDTSGVASGLSALKGRKRFGLTVLSGALAGLGQIPFGAPVSAITLLLALFGLGLFFALSSTARAGWPAFGTGWTVGTAYFAVSLHWIVEPFLVDLPRHGWMAPFALVFMATGLALFWGAAVWLARRIANTPFAFALAWAASLGLAEFARGHVLTGFPWALLGYIWVDTPALGAAAFLGPYGLTLATTALVGFLGLALLVRDLGWRTRGWAIAGSWAVLFAIWPVFPSAPTDLEPADITVRLVQPNAPQREKWDPERVNVFFSRQLAFTADAEAPRPDIILWPETAIPWELSGAATAIDFMAEAANGTPLVFGANRRNGDRAHNSLAIIGADGTLTHTYDKHHLVPFGEYIPLRPIADRVGLTGLASRGGSGFSPGPGPQTLDLGTLGKALPLICYEAIFPANLLQSPERPTWIMQITNDAWFGETAGPQQHLVQARFRAAEQGLPLVRVANTGISAVIDANGQITASIPLGQEGFLDAPLPAPHPPTLYAKTGNSPTILALLFLFAAAFLLQRRNTH